MKMNKITLKKNNKKMSHRKFNYGIISIICLNLVNSLHHKVEITSEKNNRY